MPAIARSLQDAIGAHHAGDLPRAEAICRDIVRIDPGHADALHLLGLAAFQQNQHPQAVDYLSRAIQSDDSRATYYGDLGVASLRTGNRDHAQECFERALEIDPQFADAHFNMGTLHVDTRNWDAARECFARGLKINGDDAPAWHALGNVHEIQQQFPKAIECYRHVIRLDPDHATAHTGIGNALQKMAATTGTVRQTIASPDDVLDHLERTIRETPTTAIPFPHVNFANVFPEEFYERLLDHLPETQFYEQLMHHDAILPNGESARRSFALDSQTINTLPVKQREFWTAYAPVFQSSRVVNAIFALFGQRTNAVPQVRLFRDLAGYKILPHPDIPEKLVTTQFYLPRDRTRPHLGTCLYEKVADVPPTFQKAKQFEFAPNTGYSFNVCESSWHGVEETGAYEAPRDTLMIMLYDPSSVRTDY